MELLIEEEILNEFSDRNVRGRILIKRSVLSSTTAYNLRSSGTAISPELTGELLTQKSERVVKKFTLQSTKNKMSEEPTVPTTIDSATLICYRECLSNLEKFNGGEEEKMLQFINNIERIGKMINANHNILHCMCTAKLNGEAKRWYENNTSLNDWACLKTALLDRFSQSDSSSRVFEELKERKQKSDETITSYYDDIMKLCRAYDSTMSNKMKISWLENGVQDSLKIPIKRQMKALPEEKRTAEEFLKIAKDEYELQHKTRPGTEPTSTYAPYFTNTVSSTLSRTENRPTHTKPNTEYSSHRTFQRRSSPPNSQVDTSKRTFTSYRNSNNQEQGKFRFKRSTTSRSSGTTTRKFTPCLICQRENHRTIDCYEKKPDGCYKCGQSDHKIHDCPEVFC